MELFSLFCVAAYCAVAAVVGIRMLWLATRTGQAPELLIGSALLTGSVIGYPATVAAMIAAGSSPEWEVRSIAVGHLALHVCSWIMVLAWYSVYHRGGAAARTCVAVMTVLLFVALVERLAAITVDSLAAGRVVALPSHESVSCQSIPYVLMAASGFRYHALLLRRIPLGLADPVVADRIRLWSWVSVLVFTQYAWSFATLHVWENAAVAPASRVVVGGIGLSMALLLGLAFFPPERYLLRVRERAAASANAVG